MKKINFEKIIKDAQEREQIADRKYNRRNSNFTEAFQESFAPFKAAMMDLHLEPDEAARINKIFDNSAENLRQRLVPDYRKPYPAPDASNS